MNNKWESLSLNLKSELMKLYVQNGIYSLDTIKQHYNSFADGGPTNKKSSSVTNGVTVNGTDYFPISETEALEHEGKVQPNDLHAPSLMLKPVTIKASHPIRKWDTTIDIDDPDFKQLYQHYLNREEAGKDYMKWAAPLAMSPLAFIAGPTVMKVMNNPWVDAAFTVDAVRNLPTALGDIRDNFSEGKIGRGLLQTGETALDLWGAGKLGKTFNKAWQKTFTQNPMLGIVLQSTKPSINKGGNILGDLKVNSKFGINDLGKTIGNDNNPKFDFKQMLRDLRYELDPRYVRVYHASPNMFDINNFNLASGNNSGLHVSIGELAKGIASNNEHLYKGYALKPSFRFYDVGSNGAAMFPRSFGKYDTPDENTSKFLESTFHKKGLEFAKKIHPDLQIEENTLYTIPNPDANEAKRMSYYLNNTVKGTFDNSKTRSVNLAKEIFPNESDDFIRTLNDYEHKYRTLDSKKSYAELYQEKQKLNEEVSKLLQQKGYKTGIYVNNNPFELGYSLNDNSLSIFSHDALKNARRIKQDGGYLYTDGGK